MDQLLSFIGEFIFETLSYHLGRWTVIAVTLGRVRPLRTARSERWLGVLGAIELLTLVLGGFVLWLYHG